MRDLSSSERDILMTLWHKTKDWSIFHCVKNQVTPLLSQVKRLESVTIDYPKRRYSAEHASKYAKNMFKHDPVDYVTVAVKLSDSTVISLKLEKYYNVSSVMVLDGWKKEEQKGAKKWFVYVVRCSDNSLYCGITTDVTRRVGEHNTSPKGSKYTQSRRPVKLVKSWCVDTRSEAAKAELRFKALSKAEKEKIVSKET